MGDMSFSWTRMKNRGGINCPSREEFHIYRLPPSSIQTRKFEPVSEADILWMIRPDSSASDPSRINESIQYYQRGVNPAVEIDYNNGMSPATRTPGINQAQVGSPYKIEVVRPPLFPVETTNPISRPRTHQTIDVESNPGLPNGVASNTLAHDYDAGNVMNSIHFAPAGSPIQPTAFYKLEVPSVMSARFAINENKRDNYTMLTNPSTNMNNVNVNDLVQKEVTPYGTIIRPLYSAQTNPSMNKGDNNINQDDLKIKKEILLQNIRPNFSVVLYDPNNHVSTEVSSNIREKNNISIQAALGMPIVVTQQNGQKIKLKDYNYTIVQTNIGTDMLILNIEDPNIHLDRNVPVYAGMTNLNTPNDITEVVNQEYDLEGKLGAFVQPSINLVNYYEQEERQDKQLNKQVFHSSYDNQSSSIPLMFQRELPNLKEQAMNKQIRSESYNRISL